MKWIGEDNEPVIRDEFEMMLAVRGESDVARKIADNYFFEPWSEFTAPLVVKYLQGSIRRDVLITLSRQTPVISIWKHWRNSEATSVPRNDYVYRHTSKLSVTL